MLYKKRAAFTLIEVMVAVMIISVVIMALLKMYANNTHIFNSIKNQIKTNQYASLLIGNKEYGFENKNLYLYDLVSDFDIESDLRRVLKEKKVEIIYQEIQSIDLSEDTNETQDASSANIVLEIGSSVLKSDDFSLALVRLRIK